MQMGELTAIELANEALDECPFDHKDEKPLEVKNDLVGGGTTLGGKMDKGEGTHIGQTGLPKRPAPVNDPDHCLHGKAKPIELPKHTPAFFPLTCAAHHLIPAQASLRSSKLTQWLVHGSISSQVKDGKAEGAGRLCQNIGYDVNGLENGVWLQGPYALNTDAVRLEMGLPLQSSQGSKKRKGPVDVMQTEIVKATQVAPNEPPETELEPEDTPPGAATTAAPSGTYEPDQGRTGTARTGKLTKHPTKCVGPFPELYHYYFLYTASAMQKVKAQYHDAHVDYSERVREALDEINTRVIKFAVGGVCPKCKEKNKERNESSEDFPPPTGLIPTLDRLSNKLRTHVACAPQNWMWPLYTSKMAVHYWVYEHDSALRLP